MSADLSDYFREMIEKDIDPAVCVECFFIDYDIPPGAQSMLMGPLKTFAAGVRTSMTTRAARRIFVADSDKAVIDPREMKRALGRNSFAVGDGTWVEFLKATPEQHEMRASMLRRIAKGFETSAQVHDQCASIIRECGVTCLDEVPEETRPHPVVVAPALT